MTERIPNGHIMIPPSLMISSRLTLVVDEEESAPRAAPVVASSAGAESRSRVMNPGQFIHCLRTFKYGSCVWRGAFMPQRGKGDAPGEGEGDPSPESARARSIAIFG